MVSNQPAKINVEGIRRLALRPMEGEQALNSKGMVDKRLFAGENKLTAVRDDTSLWSLKYEMGATPEELKNAYTKFSTLFAHAKIYFAKRNIEVKEILDHG